MSQCRTRWEFKKAVPEILQSNELINWIETCLAYQIISAVKSMNTLHVFFQVRFLFFDYFFKYFFNPGIKESLLVSSLELLGVICLFFENGPKLPAVLARLRLPSKQSIIGRSHSRHILAHLIPFRPTRNQNDPIFHCR